MKVALLANSASSLWPFTDCRASWSTRHGSACAVTPAASAEVGYGRVNCAPPVDSSAGGAQWIKNVDFFFSRTLSLDFFSQCEVLRGYGGLQAAAALPQFALVAVQCHLLQGGGGRRCCLHLGLRSRCAPWGKKNKTFPIRARQLHRCHCFSKKSQQHLAD